MYSAVFPGLTLEVFSLFDQPVASQQNEPGIDSRYQYVSLTEVIQIVASFGSFCASIAIFGSNRSTWFSFPRVAQCSALYGLSGRPIHSDPSLARNFRGKF